MKRAVGYCDNNECEEFSKGTFLLNPDDNFYCSRCRRPGWIEVESVFDIDTHNGMYKTVKVEFSFNPLLRKYKETAIVTISELPVGGVYIIRSPMIKTESRALKTGEYALNHLNAGQKDWRRAETILSFDLPAEDFRKECQKIDQILSKKSRRLNNVLERN